MFLDMPTNHCSGMAAMLYKVGLIHNNHWKDFLVTDDPLRRIGCSLSFKYNLVKGNIYIPFKIACSRRK